MIPPVNSPSRRASAITFASLALAGALACAAIAETPQSVLRASFGSMADGTEIGSFTLSNSRGATAKVITFGAILAELRMPDRDGKFAGVIREAVASPQSFERGFPQSGAVFGRVANRIARGRFTLDGTEHQLTTNIGPNHIHGGRKNFSRVVWKSLPSAEPGTAAVTLAYTSPHGEEGFPGNLSVTVRYTLTDENTLRIDYTATTDRPTPVNLTNHAYFNLAGEGDVLDTELTLAASRHTVVDEALIPTGEIRGVKGTPLDFTQPAKLGARASALGASRRYDHNFVLDRPDGDTSLRFAARAAEPRSGRVMEVWTTEPGVQLYTSPLGDGPAKDRPGTFCLETQHFPDSVNHPHFPTTILRPGETFRSATEFRFSTR